MMGKLNANFVLFMSSRFGNPGTINLFHKSPVPYLYFGHGRAGIYLKFFLFLTNQHVA